MLDKIIKQFETMEKFHDVDYIPSIPIVDQDTYNNIIIPNLIRCGAIPKKELTIGKTYIGNCRNANKAVWDGKVFIYQRTKFGHTSSEKINHFEDDNGFDLFIPIRTIDE